MLKVIALREISDNIMSHTETKVFDMETPVKNIILWGTNYPNKGLHPLDLRSKLILTVADVLNTD
jgi:hypothetical protein